MNPYTFRAWPTLSTPSPSSSSSAFSMTFTSITATTTTTSLTTTPNASSDNHHAPSWVERGPSTFTATTTSTTATYPSMYPYPTQAAPWPPSYGYLTPPSVYSPSFQTTASGLEAVPVTPPAISGSTHEPSAAEGYERKWQGPSTSFSTPSPEVATVGQRLNLRVDSVGGVPVGRKTYEDYRWRSNFGPGTPLGELGSGGGGGGGGGGGRGGGGEGGEDWEGGGGQGGIVGEIQEEVPLCQRSCCALSIPSGQGSKLNGLWPVDGSFSALRSPWPLWLNGGSDVGGGGGATPMAEVCGVAAGLGFNPGRPGGVSTVFPGLCPRSHHGAYHHLQQHPQEVNPTAAAVGGGMVPLPCSSAVLSASRVTLRKRRRPYTRAQRSQLEEEYLQSRYVSRGRRWELSQTVHLSERQIKIWFQNRRIKARKLQKRERSSPQPVGSSVSSPVGSMPGVVALPQQPGHMTASQHSPLLPVHSLSHHAHLVGPRSMATGDLLKSEADNA